MPRCRSCGAVVSDSYARVCGDNQGRVHDCPECNGGVGPTGGTDQYLTEVAPETYRDLAGTAE